MYTIHKWRWRNQVNRLDRNAEQANGQIQQALGMQSAEEEEENEAEKREEKKME